MLSNKIITRNLSMLHRNSHRNRDDYYPGYRYPKTLIGYVVWLYHRFMVSLRDV